MGPFVIYSVRTSHNPTVFYKSICIQEKEKPYMSILSTFTHTKIPKHPPINPPKLRPCGPDSQRVRKCYRHEYTNYCTITVKPFLSGFICKRDRRRNYIYRMERCTINMGRGDIKTKFYDIATSHSLLTSLCVECK